MNTPIDFFSEIYSHNEQHIQKVEYGYPVLFSLLDVLLIGSLELFDEIIVFIVVYSYHDQFMIFAL